MIAYLTISLLPLILSIFFDLNSNSVEAKKSKRNYIIICGVILFLFLAFRSHLIGSTDTKNYYNMMKRAISASSWKNYYIEDGVETGFQFFVFLLSRIFKNPQWIIIISTGIYIVSTCIFIYKNSDNVVLSVVMYITLGLMDFQMQGMRQAIAMSICLFAFEFAKNKRFVPFLLTCLLATQMHISSMTFVVVYFVLNMRNRPFKALLMVVASIVLLLSSELIVNIGNNAFDMDYNTVTVKSGGVIAVLIYVLILTFPFFINNDARKDDDIMNLFYFTILGFVCYLMRYTGTIIAERISFYFMFGQILLLPKALKRLVINEREIIKLIVCILSIALFAYRLIGSDLLPFEFFWNV